MKIVFIGHSHHLTTRSAIFFTSILEDQGSVDYRWDDSWKTGEVVLDWTGLAQFDLIVVWQIPYIADRIPKALFQRCVYVPMHDAVSTLEDKFWRKLRGMRVLCFSMEDHVKALKNRVQSRYIRYFPPLDAIPQATFEDGLKLFFWQRRELPNWRSLSAALPMSQFSRIHLHGAPDPGCGKFVRPVVSEMRKFSISISEWLDDKAQYHQLLDACNVFVTPRLEEGIGMAMLEAMVRGMVVVAANGSTMNEYIIDGLNGYLLPSNQQDAVEIGHPEEVSAMAREYLVKGYTLFLQSLPALVAYLQAPSDRRFDRIIDPLWALIHARLPGSLVRKVDKAGARRDRNSVQRPQVTVVTLMGKGRQALARTMASVLSQSQVSMEYLMVDGGSADSAVELARTQEGRIRVVVTDGAAPGAAMNFAVDQCRGKYVIFMQAGDVFFDEQALANALLGAPDEAVVIYGHHLDQPKPHQPRFRRATHLPLACQRLKLGSPDPEWRLGLPWMAATFVLASALKQRPYRWAEFPAAADHEFLFELMSVGARVYHANTTVSVLGGDSALRLESTQYLKDWSTILAAHEGACDSPADF